MALLDEYDVDALFGPDPIPWDRYEMAKCPSYRFLVATLGSDNVAFLMGVVRGQVNQMMGGPLADERMAAVEALVRLKGYPRLDAGLDLTRSADLVIRGWEGPDFWLVKNRFSRPGAATRKEVYALCKQSFEAEAQRLSAGGTRTQRIVVLDPTNPMKQMALAHRAPVMKTVLEFLEFLQLRVTDAPTMPEA